MSASAVDIRTAATRMLYGRRAPDEIIADLQACSGILQREIESWNDTPSKVALTSAETSAEGVRRLLMQLRLTIQNSAEVA